eukprot:s3748_g7.t1
MSSEFCRSQDDRRALRATLPLRLQGAISLFRLLRPQPGSLGGRRGRHVRGTWRCDAMRRDATRCDAMRRDALCRDLPRRKGSGCFLSSRWDRRPDFVARLHGSSHGKACHNVC